eukprot:maker-scaffold123_size333416-snap-gene-0.10 protein:Tk05316 transcript:maker-scaffold123_size333416-snap-gene-0.10-mRNA-1 annotation:"vasopressin v1a"
MELGSKTLFLGVFIIAIVVSNVCSVIAILRRRPKINRMYFFLLNLSVADMLNAFLTLLPEFIWSLAIFPSPGNIECKIVKYLQMFAPYLTSYVLVMTAVDRFQTICYPMENRFWKLMDSCKKVALAWVLSLLFCIPQIFLYASKAENGISTYYISEIYVTWFGLTSFFIPLMALSFFYVRICRAIRQNLNSKQKVNFITLTTASIESSQTKPRPWYRASFRRPSPELSSVEMDIVPKRRKFTSCSDLRPRTHSVGGISRAKIKSVKQTIIIILGYILCSCPGVVYQLGLIWFKDNNTLTQSTEWFFWLMSLNSLLNPWLYIALNRELQVAFKRFLFCQDPPGPWSNCSQNHSWRHDKTQQRHHQHTSRHQNGLDSSLSKVRPVRNGQTNSEGDLLLMANAKEEQNGLGLGVEGPQNRSRPILMGNGCTSFKVHWSSQASGSAINLRINHFDSTRRQMRLAQPNEEDPNEDDDGYSTNEESLVRRRSFS